MRLGYLAPYSPGLFGEARKMGFEAVELRVNWKADGGQIDAGADLQKIVDEMEESGVGLTALACYNVPPVNDARSIRKAFTQMCGMAKKLKTGVIATMAYRTPGASIEEDLPAFKKSFGAAAKVAADKGLKIAIENWPGAITGYGPYLWRSMAVTPMTWEMMFDAVPNKALGLEYDPSHLFWQQVDYIKAIQTFRARIHHVHAKDTLTQPKVLAKGGVHAKGWWRFTIPGLGEVDWNAVFEGLVKARYKGDIAIEHEDSKFGGSRRNLGFKKGRAFLDPFVKRTSRRVAGK